MEKQLTLKYVTNFQNNIFSYSPKFDLFNVIDLKQLHDLFKKYKYITNVVIIEQKINNEEKILHRLINGQLKESTLIYLNQKIEHMQHDIIVDSVFDINELVINIINFIEISDKEKSYIIINEIINEYEEDKKIKKLALF